MNKFYTLTFFSLLIFLTALEGFAALEIGSVSPRVATYDELLHAIRGVKTASEARIEAAVEQEKVREAWETGKLIDKHILLHKERAEYGKRVLNRLSKDLGVSQTELSFMLQFARAYPIYSRANKLSWAHYRELLSLNDPKERDEVTREAVEKDWNRDQVREEVRRRLAENPEEVVSGPPRLEAQKGILDTYRIVLAPLRKDGFGENLGFSSEPSLVIDLGFSNYYLPPGGLAGFKEGDIVRVSKGKLELVKGATESLVAFQLFSYRARVLEITDGDTLWTLVDLGFGFTTKQQLRLRGLDAPEIESAEGMEAKHFVEKELGVTASERISKSSRAVIGAPAPIIITSSKSDKYDRYLADVFYETKDGEQYLNNRLLQNELAQRV